MEKDKKVEFIGIGTVIISHILRWIMHTANNHCAETFCRYLNFTWYLYMFFGFMMWAGFVIFVIGAIMGIRRIHNEKKNNK